jgi:hypothetical protein
MFFEGIEMGAVVGIGDNVTKEVDAVCVREDGRLLLVLLCDAVSGLCRWILPGCKVKPEESAESSLEKEIEKELEESSFQIESTFYPDVFLGKNPFSGEEIEVQFCEVSFLNYSNMRPSHEIAAFDWISPEQALDVALYGFEYEGYPVSEVTVDIIEHLLINGNMNVFMV